MEARLALVTPEDLPQVPWVLHYSPPKKIGNSEFRGGPFARVLDNEKFLNALKHDVSMGPSGPRGNSLLQDLAALRKAVNEEKVRREQQPA
jgi:hypothetical protein